MFNERKKIVTLWAIILTAVLLAVPSDAFAQRNKSPGGLTGGARLRPGTSANERASRSVRHARDYSRDLYRYSRGARTIEPAVAKSESEQLGRNITKAQQELSAARLEIGSDPTTLATSKKIDQHLATAARQHQMLHEECCKESVDGTACMKHCSQILLELDRAQAEHDAMTRSLEIKTNKTENETATPHKQD